MGRGAGQRVLVAAGKVRKRELFDKKMSFAVRGPSPIHLSTTMEKKQPVSKSARAATGAMRESRILASRAGTSRVPRLGIGTGLAETGL